MEDITDQHLFQANADGVPTTLGRYRAKCFELLIPHSSYCDVRRFSTSRLCSLKKYYMSYIKEVNAVSEVEDQQTTRAMLIWHQVCRSFMKINF
jgi:hypothetical protein